MPGFYFEKFQNSPQDPQQYDELLRAYQQLEENAKILVRTDLELHKAKTDLDSQVSKFILLNKLSDEIHATQNPKNILKAICESLVSNLGFEKAWVLYQEREAGSALLVEYGTVPSERPRLLQLAEHTQKVVQDLPGQVVFNLDAKEQDSTIRGLLDALQVTEMVHSPLRMSEKSYGGIFAARVHAFPPLTDIDLSFFTMLGRQVAIALENAKMHAEVREMNSKLEERVAFRSKELMEANTRLLELDRIKSNFISLVSHELRTPMTSIKGFVALLLQFEEKLADGQKRSYLRIINEESDRLGRLIADLLNISRIESGRMVMRWETIQLPELLALVAQKQKSQGAATPCEYVIAEDLPPFVADRDKLEQILLNLVQNAVRFTPAGETVRILADVFEGEICIRVINPGEGIPFVHLAKIFDKFYRIENDVNRKNRGTGLGLSICRGLVDMHGGKIWAESEINKETTFTILLPYNLDKSHATLTEEPVDSTELH